MNEIQVSEIFRGIQVRLRTSYTKKTPSHKLHPLSVNASPCFEPVTLIVGACNSAAYTLPHILSICISL